jgi:hypothetical protein
MTASTRRHGMGLLGSPERVSASPADYRSFMARVVASGYYDPIPRPLARRLGWRAAAVLVRIVTQGKSNADETGWVMATPLFIEHGTGINASEQAKVFEALEGKGLVEVQYRGTYRKRFVRVNVAKLQAMLKEESN